MDLMRTSLGLSTMSLLQGIISFPRSLATSPVTRMYFILPDLPPLPPPLSLPTLTGVLGCSRRRAGHEAAELAWRSLDVRWIWLGILMWVLCAAIQVISY
jgi:hypothetical protein